jgi:hypothetical protein
MIAGSVHDVLDERPFRLAVEIGRKVKELSFGRPWESLRLIKVGNVGWVARRQLGRDLLDVARVRMCCPSTIIPG